MLGGLQAIRALADDSRGVSGVRIRLASFPSIISGVLPPLLHVISGGVTRASRW